MGDDKSAPFDDCSPEKINAARYFCPWEKQCQTKIAIQRCHRWDLCSETEKGGPLSFWLAPRQKCYGEAGAEEPLSAKLCFPSFASDGSLLDSSFLAELCLTNCRVCFLHKKGRRTPWTCHRAESTSLADISGAWEERSSPEKRMLVPLQFAVDASLAKLQHTITKCMCLSEGLFVPLMLVADAQKTRRVLFFSNHRFSAKIPENMFCISLDPTIWTFDFGPGHPISLSRSVPAFPETVWDSAAANNATEMGL